MPEFVRVTYSESRRVFVDGVDQGSTGDVIFVQTGHHFFDLGAPPDYTPSRITERVINTTQSNPMVLSFSPVLALAGAAPGEAVASVNSSIFHSSASCWAARLISDSNRVVGADARRGRTEHANCG